MQSVIDSVPAPPPLARSDGHAPNTTPPHIVIEYFNAALENPNDLYIARVGHFYHVWGPKATELSTLINIPYNTALYNTPSVAWPLRTHLETIKKLVDEGYNVRMFKSHMEKKTGVVSMFRGEPWTMKGYDGYVKALTIAHLYLVLRETDPSAGVYLDYYLQIMNWLSPKVNDMEFSGRSIVKFYDQGYKHALQLKENFIGWEDKEKAQEWIVEHILKIQLEQN